MEPIRIVFLGNPVTKKNSQRIIMVGGHPRIIPSKQYKNYEKQCLKQLTGKHKLMIDEKCCVKGLYYMQTKRKVDLLNLLEATCDILVAGHVLTDDDSKIVDNHDGSRVLYDKENPRAVIEIIPIRG